VPAQPRINGWLVLLRPEFAQRYDELRREARRLQDALSEQAYRTHPTVKLAAAVHRLVTQVVPQDPNRPEFQLKGDLAQYRRAKQHGLPPRYRLFWVFSSSERVIIFLYLNDETTLRKEGDQNDPYEIFARMVRRGEIGSDFESNYAALRDAVELTGAGAETEKRPQPDTTPRRRARKKR
jgi:toxin YhaV